MNSKSKQSDESSSDATLTSGSSGNDSSGNDSSGNDSSGSDSTGSEAFPPFVELVRPQSTARSAPPDAVSKDLLRMASESSQGDRRGRLESRSPVLDRLGPWKIEREIGRGGMGIVFAAIHEQTQARAALKFLPSTGGVDARRLERFRHEAEIIQRLAHPNIVRLQSIEHIDGHHFLVMQLIDGVSLDRVVGSISSHHSSSARTAIGARTDSPKPPVSNSAAADEWLNEKLFGSGRDRFRYIARLIQQAAQALSYAHSQRVIHRDMKPSNLLVDRDDELWITDFGLAQVQGEQGLTATGDLLGTLRYMSPEQAMASRVPVDHRTDVYSLGATLYELLGGQAPFRADDRKELLRQVLFDEPQPLHRVDEAIPVSLQIIVGKAMRKDPRSRYSTAGEMADDLVRFLSDAPIQARRPSRLEPLLRWSRRNVALTISMLIVATLLIVLSVGQLVYSELDERHERTVRLLKRTEAAEQESFAFATLRDVARYRQTGLSGLQSQMERLQIETELLSQDVKTELRNEWLSCLARADWDFDRSFPRDSDVIAVSPADLVIAEAIGEKSSPCIRIRALQVQIPRFEVTSDPIGFPVAAMWFSRGGKFVTATDLNGFWQIIRVSDGRRMFEIAQLARGCDVCDATGQIVFWHYSPVVMLGVMNGETTTPALQTLPIAAQARLVRLSPDGRSMAILEEQGLAVLKLMSITGNMKWQHPAGRAMTVAWSSDSRYLAIPNQSETIIVREAGSARIVSTLTGVHDIVSGIEWDPTGNYLLTTAWNGETLIRHAWTDRVLVRSHQKLDAIGFSHDGRRIGWSFDNLDPVEGRRFIRIASWSPGMVNELPWDSGDGLERPTGVNFHGESRFAVVTAPFGLQLLDLETGMALQRIPTESVMDASFSETGEELIVLTRTSAVHWPVKSSSSKDRIAIALGPPRTVLMPTAQTGVLTHHGQRAVLRTSAAPDRLTAVRTADGVADDVTSESAPGLDVEVAGAYLLRRGWHSSESEVSDPDSLRRLAMINVGGGSNQAASADGQHFVSSSREQLTFWNTTTWEVNGSLRLDAPVVGARPEFHPSESLAAVRLMASRLGLIDLKSRQVIARIDELREFWASGSKFSPDGRYLVELSTQPSSVRVWRIAELRAKLQQQGLNWSDSRRFETLDQNSTELLPSNAITNKQIPDLILTVSGADQIANYSAERLKSALQRLAAEPENSSLQNLAAWRLMLAPLELRNNPEALTLSRRACLVMPDHPALRNTLGLACFRNGLFAEAEQLILKNLSASIPEDLTLDLIVLSMIAVKQNQLTAAESYRVWAERNFLSHPPSDENDLADVKTLFEERQRVGL